MKDSVFEEKYIGAKRCLIYREEDPEFLIIRPVSGDGLAGLESELELMKEMLAESPAPAKKEEAASGPRGKAVPSLMTAAFVSDDWNAELTPWEAPPVFGDKAFGSGAQGTLRYVEEELLPALTVGLGGGSAGRSVGGPAGVSPEGAPRTKLIIGGYSLAGLFSLWTAYNSSLFDGAAAVSPSIWYPGWPEYAESHGLKTGAVYLSLGDREEKTRNRTMARSGDNIRRQIELLEKDPACRACALEWNPGNHFAEHNRRMAKGLVWLIERLRS